MIAFINDSEFEPLRPIAVRRSLPERVCASHPVIRRRQRDLTPFIISLLLPGSGQVMTGRFFIGIVFLAAAAFVWFPPVNMIWPIIAVHLAAAFNALGR